MIEYQRNTLGRTGGAHPVGNAEIRIKIVRPCIPQRIIVIAQTPGTETDCGTVVPCKRVFFCLNEFIIDLVAIFVIKSLPSGFRKPVLAQHDVAGTVSISEVISTIGLLRRPFHVVIIPIVTVNAHEVVLVECAVVK